MADVTALVVTFNKNEKTVNVLGLPGVREVAVQVTVTGGAALIALGLVMKIQNTGFNAVPIGVISEWTISGIDAVGVLNLNTTEAIAAFENAASMEIKSFNLLLFTSISTELKCNGIMKVINFPSTTTEDPTTLNQAVTIASKIGYADFEDVADLDLVNGSFDALAAKVQEMLTICKGT